LKEFARQQNLSFYKWQLLDQALIHPSFVNEHHSSPDNQRLEYLGDAVLGLIVNDFLYHRYPHLAEGNMTRIKNSVVSERSLFLAARQMHLGKYLIMGRGEIQTGGMERPSNLADALEAVIAAIYLDSGLDRARDFVLSFLKTGMEGGSNEQRVKDPKSALQEIIQKKEGRVPRYEVVSEEGPAHQKEFICRVMLDQVELGRGEGSSRKVAESEAARQALHRFKE
jgi:ribonuclease-3